MKYDRAKVTVIIPAKNEGEGLERVIASVKRYASAVIVIDGHSTDATKQIVRTSGARWYLDHNKGRGEALRLGLAKAGTDVVVIVDADGSIGVPDIPKLVQPVLDGQADLVIASRRTGGSFDTGPTLSSLLRSFGSDTMTYLVNCRYHTRLTDIIYAFRAIRRSVIPHLDLRSNGFTFDQEMVVSCLKRQYRVKEIPSREFARQWGISKLRTLMGVSMFFRLLRQLYLE